jgi:predicted nucleic acid-binding protein
MRLVFADAVYWIAFVRPNDPWSEAAERVATALEGTHIVTTDEVLSEFLAALASGGEHLRRRAVEMVRLLLADPDVTVLPQSRESFVGGLDLYERRLDKGYSLVDCISMKAMRDRGIREILTNDRHFSQEGFASLLSPK